MSEHVGGTPRAAVEGFPAGQWHDTNLVRPEYVSRGRTVPRSA